LLSPPSMWDSLRERSRHHSWLPPGTLTRCRRSTLRGTARSLACCARASSIERSSFTRGGPEFTTLIPDVDYGRLLPSVKNNVHQKSKNLASARTAEQRFGARACTDRRG